MIKGINQSDKVLVLFSTLFVSYYFLYSLYMNIIYVVIHFFYRDLFRKTKKQNFITSILTIFRKFRDSPFSVNTVYLIIKVYSVQ